MDEYLTVHKEAEGLYKEKGSKFIAKIFPVNAEEEIRALLTKLRKEYHDARHHCYAYRIGIDEQKYRMNDDGEPSGTAGKPIYGQILSHELINVLIVVIRYFGGTKLGVSGLINAYRSASRDVIANAMIITKQVLVKYNIHFNYPSLNTVMKIIKEEDAEINSQDFSEQCTMQVSVHRKSATKFEKRFSIFQGVSLEKFYNAE